MKEVPMPQTQQMRKAAHQKTGRRGNKQPSHYRTHDVGIDIVLETKVAKDGTLIFRVSPLEEQTKKVSMKGKEVTRTFTSARPGRWMAVTNLVVGKLFDQLIELEEQAQQIKLYKDADSAPLRHRPFSDLPEFDLRQVVVEGVDEALGEKTKKRKRKKKAQPEAKAQPEKQPKKQPKPKPRRRRSWKTDAADRMEAMTSRLKEVRRKLRALHTED